MTPSSKKSFVKGFFDSEGHIYYDHIGMANTNERYSQVVYDALLSLGFKPTVSVWDRSTIRPHYKTIHRIRLFGKEQMARFIETVGVTIDRKLGKLTPAIKVVRDKERLKCFVIPYVRRRQIIYDDEFHVIARARSKKRRELKNRSGNKTFGSSLIKSEDHVKPIAIVN